MPALNSCTRCGAELRPQDSEGFCTRCLLEGGLEESQAETKVPGPAQTQAPLTEGEHRTSNGEHGTVRNFGDYQLLEEIARGGMGVVYRARQVSLNRIVAVKMLLAGPLATKDFIQRFRTESAAAASLQHPNIVAIHEVGFADGQHFFAMDFVEGLTLAQLVAKGPLPARQAATYLKAIADAIHFAHERNVLHRDLKPSNVLIDSASDQPRLTDFGLAKRLEAETDLTLSGQVLGSPNYMSPEQALAKRGTAGKHSDVYSLGAILYHLLTGRPPFQGETLTDVLHQVVNIEPVAPRLLNPSVPVDLETICLKSLEKEPEKRYQTSQALADELGRFLKDEPVHARPVTRGERAWRWCRRKPVLAGALATAAGLLLIVVIGSPIATDRINHERRRAVQGELAARQGELAARQIAYASEMNAVQQKLAMNDLGQAVRFLDRNRPNAKSAIGNAKSEIDLRGWEWRYLWQQCQSDPPHLTLFKTEEAPLRSLAVSHDGKWLAVTGRDGRDVGNVSLWDLRTRKKIETISADSNRGQVAFSPVELLLTFSVVSTNLAATQNPYSIHFWDAATRKNLDIELPLGNRCGRLLFSGDGQTLVTCTDYPEGECTLWRVRDGKKLSSFPTPHVIAEENGIPFAVTRDLSFAAYATIPDARIHVIDLVTREVLWTQPAAEEEVLGLAFSPDGKTLASGAGYAESAIRLWDVASDQEISRLEGHRSFVEALVFWPDGKTLASGSGDQTIRLWDVSDVAHPRALNELRGHLNEVWSLALLPDNKTIVSYGKDGSACVWDTTPNQRRVGIKLPSKLATWKFAQDSRSVLTVDQSGQVARWSGADFQTKEPLADIGTNFFRSPHNWNQWPALIAEDGRWLAVGSSNGVLQVWDLQNRALLRQATILDEEVFPRAFLAAGKKLLIGQADGSLHEWDLAAWKETGSWRGVKHMMSLVFSADERWCLMSGFKPSLLREMATGRETSLTNRTAFAANASKAAFSQDGKLFATSSFDGSARLWETATLHEVASFGSFLHGVNSVAFSPDRKRLVTGSNGKEAIKLWDVESHQEVLTLEGQGSSFSLSAFSPDGNVLGSMNASGLLHLWRAPSWTEIEATEARQKIEAQQP